MTADHFQQLLDTFVKRSPFQPFTIELVGGGRVEVDHSRAIVTRDGVAVYVAPGGVPVLFDHGGVTAIVADTAGASVP